MKTIGKKIMAIPNATAILPLVLLCILAALVNPIFLSLENLSDLMRNISYAVIPATGLTFMIISGNLDLSVGSILTLGGTVTAWCMNKYFGMGLGGAIISVIIALVICGAIGMLNFFLCVKCGIPTMIATLGVSYAIEGVISVVTLAQPLYMTGSPIVVLGKGSILGVKITIWIAAIIIAIMHYLLRYTTFGRKSMALGANPEATRLAGIQIDKVKAVIYCMVGVLSGFAGILTASRLSCAYSTAGTGKALVYIAGVTIGGNSIFGGRGTVIGTLLGIAIMETITDALVLMNVSTYWQQLCVGAIMIFACAIDAAKSKSQSTIRVKKRT